CRYAIRATLELAHHGVDRSLTIAEIAEAQKIPAGFLAVILTDLRRAGIVRSHRGARGGYSLAVEPRGLSVEDVISAVDGPIEPPAAFRARRSRDDYVWGDGVLAALLEQAATTVSGIFAATSYADLIERESLNAQTPVANYCI
ncbi:MAG TPA: Rrf2 family transcriptional regulator, partial [Phycisphaerae bacterium]|nr:Rrf2 family transcriptional regulator [Phycisphaerae bacterium]